MATHDKPFPWGCTCRQEMVMPDGPTLTCRNCGTEWANSYDEEGKYGKTAKLEAELAALQAKHERLREAVGQILPHLIGQREVTIGREEWDYLNQIAESEGE